MSAGKKPYYWKDLKDFCNTLTEDQLNYQVSWIGEYRGGNVANVESFAEDMIDPSGEGIEPVSVYEGDKDFDIEQETVVFEKGTPMIWVD